MCAIANKVNRLHHHYGTAPTINLATRAILGADLWAKGGYGIKTGTQAALLVNVSRPSVDAALLVLKSGDQSLLADVMADRISLFRAASKVRNRIKLIEAFKTATPDDRVAFGQAVGIAEIWDSTIMPAL